MKMNFAHGVLPLLISLLLIGCEKGSNAKDAKIDPPIQLEVIAPAIESQLVSEIGDRFVKVGKVEYRPAGTENGNAYFAEVYYLDEGHEKRCLIRFKRIDDGSGILTYMGSFPLSNLSEYRDEPTKLCPIKIDVMMNEPTT